MRLKNRPDILFCACSMNANIEKDIADLFTNKKKFSFAS